MGRRTGPWWRRLRSVLPWTLVAGIGCGLEGPSTPGDVPLGWTAPAVYTLGGADATDWSAFGEVSGVGFDARGWLYVLDGQARRVTVVDTLGERVGTVGAPGEGPGELRFPSDLVVHPDGAVTVLDPGHGGFVVYDRAGAWVRTVPLDAEDPGMPAGPLRRGADGRLYAAAEPRSDGAPPETPPARVPVVGFSDRDGGGARVVAAAWRPPQPETGGLDPAATGGLRVRLPPVLGFHPEVLVAPLPDGRVAVVDSFAYRVRLVGPGDLPDTVLSRPGSPAPVTRELREAERERRLAEVAREPGRRVVSNAEGEVAAAPDDAVLRLERARIEAMGFHDLVPVLARLGADPQGRLWVQRTGVIPWTPGPVDVFTAGDGYLGTLAPGALPVPDAFGPMGLAAWIGTDAMGAATVRVGRIRDGDGPPSP